MAPSFRAWGGGSSTSSSGSSNFIIKQATAQKQSDNQIGALDDLRRRNEELEREVRERAEREEKMRQELEMAQKRARVAEEAEELLCSQLGELEAEAVDQLREFQSQITSLTHQLARAQILLGSSSASSTIRL